MTQGKLLGPCVKITKISKCKSFKIGLFMGTITFYLKWDCQKPKYQPPIVTPICYCSESRKLARSSKGFLVKPPVSRLVNILAVSSLMRFWWLILFWLKIDLPTIFLKHTMGYAHSLGETLSCFRFPLVPQSIVIIVLSPKLLLFIGKWILFREHQAGTGPYCVIQP